MRIPFSHYRQFLSEITLREKRLVYEGDGERPCKGNEKCNPKSPKSPEPYPDPINDPKKEPDFSDMKFDIRPDEPTHIYEKGKVKQNRSDQIRDMNKEQFRDHLKKMFGKHMGEQMKGERTRQNQLARGKRKAEARDRFADTKKGRKKQEAWADKALADSDVTFKEAEAQVAQIGENPFDADAFNDMLNNITEDVWSTAEFQRGTVNYLKAYDKAWNMYIDFAEEQKNEKGLDDHPLFRSGAFRNRKAPGIYQNGELIRVPSNFPGIGNRPTSTYAAAKVRERGGMPQNPARDFLKKEEQSVRDGSETIWRKNFQNKNPMPKPGEEDAYVQKLVDQNLRKQGFQQAKVDASRAPDVDALRLPAEADRKTERDHVNAHENIDARDRGAVVGTLSKTLGLNVGSVKEFNKKVVLAEFIPGSRVAGMPQLMVYSTREKLRRGEAQPRQSGIVIVDRDEEDARESADVRVLEFTKVDQLFDDDAGEWDAVLVGSLSNDQLRVYQSIAKMKNSGKKLDDPRTYQQLISEGWSESPKIPFALDELHSVCRGRELMEKLRAIYKSPSAMEDNWRQSANPKLDLNPEFEHLLKNSTGRDKALLKAIYMKQMNPESKSETAIFLDKKWAYWLKY